MDTGKLAMTTNTLSFSQLPNGIEEEREGERNEE